MTLVQPDIDLSQVLLAIINYACRPVIFC